MPSGARADRLPDAAGAGVVLAVAVFLGWKFAHLFPEVEFVDWIASPAGATTKASLESVFSFTPDGFSRHVSLIYSSLLGRACGTDVVCVNVLAFLPILAAGLLLYALARAVRLPASGAAAIALVMLVSEPSFNVLSWQATMHDRLAAAFTFLTMLVIVEVVRRARSTWRFVVPWAIVLSVLCLLAVNTKEPAWVLIPLAAAAPLVLTRDRRQAVAAALTLAVPVAVMTVHAILDLVALADDPVSSAHVGNGSISDNLPVLTRVAVPGGMVVAVLLVVLSAAAAALAWRRWRERPEAMELARVAVWVGLGTAVAWVIPLRTEFPSGFYMFVPLGLAALATGAALRGGFIALSDHGRARGRYAGVAIGVALAAWFVVGSAGWRWTAYGDWLALDASFRGGLDRLAEIRRERPDESVQFQAHPEVFAAYRFVTANPARNFWRFAGAQLPTDGSHPIGVQLAGCGGQGTVIVRLDERMRPVGACPAR